LILVFLKIQFEIHVQEVDLKVSTGSRGFLPHYTDNENNFNQRTVSVYDYPCNTHTYSTSGGSMAGRIREVFTGE
jgi:hypothetical protein